MPRLTRRKLATLAAGMFLSGGAAQALPPVADLPRQVGGGDVLSQPLGHPAADRARRQAEDISRPRISESEAADIARQRYGGRVLSVRWTGKHYRVKLLSDGEMRIVIIE